MTEVIYKYNYIIFSLGNALLVQHYYLLFKPKHVFTFFVSCGKLSKQSLVSHILRTTEFIDDWGWYGGNDDSSEMQTLFSSTRILRDYDINPWGNPS